MSLNKIVVLGAGGMLGTDFVNLCRSNGQNIGVFDLPKFDITNYNQLKEAVDSGRFIVNCAAYTNVDGAESEQELAYKVNAEAIGRLGELAKKSGKWVLHISTDFVFDGEGDKPYLETDEPNPVNVYGRSKLEGERLLAQSQCEYAIIRVQWTYGKYGNNFVTKLLEMAKSGRALTIVNDQIGSPTATVEVAKIMRRFLEKRTQGLYHYAASGYISRYEMAEFVFNKLDLKVDMSPCSSNDFKTPARRPLTSRFNCSKISQLLDIKIENWQIPLKKYLGQL
jgi:dTDP-4-dehydrorhamnose reductase